MALIAGPNDTSSGAFPVASHGVSGRGHTPASDTAHGLVSNALDAYGHDNREGSE